MMRQSLQPIAAIIDKDTANGLLIVWLTTTTEKSATSGTDV